MAKIFSRKELVAAVAAETGLTKVQINKVFDAAGKIQKSKLKAGYAVKTQNGKIVITTRKARKGVNPQTGKTITIPACKKPKFVFSTDFKKGF